MLTYPPETPNNKHSYITQTAEAAHVLRELSSAALPRTVEARIENPHLEKFDDYSMNAIVDLKHDVVKNLALALLTCHACLLHCA